jgi:hypothetical protein
VVAPLCDLLLTRRTPPSPPAGLLAKRRAQALVYSCTSLRLSLPSFCPSPSLS